jgi:Fe2+ transport system protein FeoA
VVRAVQAVTNMKSTFKMSLDVMPEGVPACIGRIEAAEADVERLEAMGLCAGRTVEVVQAGNPMIVRVLGTRIGLAAVLARSVHVMAEFGR